MIERFGYHKLVRLAVRAISALVIAPGLAVATGRIDVIVSHDNAAYHAWYDAMVGRLHGSVDGVQIQMRVAPAGESTADLVVGAGAGASEEVLNRHPTIPAIVTLLTHHEAEADLARYGRRRTAAATALYLDQPPARYVSLIRAVLPEAVRVAVLYGSVSRGDRRLLLEAAGRAGLAMVDAELAAGANIVQVLEPLLENSDVLFVPPDPEVSSEKNVYPLLLASYRRRIPVIGFSAAYVTAGALAAVYSDPAQLGEQTGDVVARYLRQDHRLPAPQYAKDFQVSVNRYVARSLGLAVPDEAELFRRLLTEEKEGGR